MKEINVTWIAQIIKTITLPRSEIWLVYLNFISIPSENDNKTKCNW